MSVEESEHLEREALSRILRATASKSARVITYGAAVLGMTALVPGVQLPPELAGVASNFGVEAIGGIIDWVVASGHRITDDEIRQAVEEAIDQRRVNELLTREGFYEAFALFRRTQRTLQEQNDDILTILSSLESTVEMMVRDSESLRGIGACERIRREAADGLAKTQQLGQFTLRPTGDSLKVFVSSKMTELRDVRSVVSDALRHHRYEVFVYEDSAGAQPDTVMTTSLREVEEADIYVGLFWQRYGEVTVKEYFHARKLRRPCFVYIRGKDSPRDRELEMFLEAEICDPVKGVTYDYFDDVVQLGSDVVCDIGDWRTRWLRENVTQRNEVEASFEKIREMTEKMLPSSSDPLLEVIDE